MRLDREVECHASRTIRDHPLVPRVQHRWQHRFVQQRIPHPLTNDNVYVLNRQFNLLALALDQRDLVGLFEVKHVIDNTVSA